MKNRLFFTASCIVMLSAITLASPQYELVDLGTLGGASSWASGINNQGQIVGRSTTAEGIAKAFFWDEKSGMQPIGDPGAYSPAINDNGVAVISNSSKLFTWDSINGLQEALPNYFNPHEINNVGQIVGTYNNWPAIWSAAEGLEIFGNTGMPVGINNHGQFVGNYGRFWDSDGTITYLQRLGGSVSASSINDKMQITGSAVIGDTGMRHAVIWDMQTGTIQDIGALGETSFGSDINENGDVVGRDIGVGHAFLWMQEYGMMDLNDIVNGTGFGWTIESALEINDNGWIAAVATNLDGQERAVLLRPVPEPATALFMITGLCLLRRREP
jgi:probable HAF family extracellular repeat protein